MIEITNKTLSEMVEKIIQEVNPEKIYLFGSRAAGEARFDSDLDLLVVVRDPFGPDRSRWKELCRIRQALSSFHIAKDILVYSVDEMEEWKNSINHIIGKTLRKGKLLYARS